MSADRPSVRALMILALAGIALSACRTSPPRSPDVIGDALEESQSAAAETEPPPAAVQQELIPPLDTGERGQPEAERFDIAVDNIPARDFFMGLVEGTPYNVVVAPAVQGRLSLTLNDVTVAQVMRVVRDVYGYEYRRVGGVYRITPARARTRVFPLNYLNVTRSGRSSTRVNSGQLTDASGGRQRFAGSGNLPGGISGTRPEPRGDRGTLSGTRIETEAGDINVWSELTRAVGVIIGCGLSRGDEDTGDGNNDKLRALRCADGQRHVVASPQTGTLVVRAMPAQLREVEDYLDRTETNLQRQVLLEAKILEVILDERFQSGIDWQSFGEIGSDGVLNLSQAGQLVTSPNEDDLPDRGVFSAVFEDRDFRGVIDLLENQGNVRVLSSPRVSTVNNQKAVIKVGSDEFFVTDISTTTTTGTATTTTPDVTLTPFFSGIALDVTPQISANGEIILHVHPSVSEVEDQTKIVTIGEDDFTLPLALSSVRESDSIIRTDTGRVVVIGGLMQDENREDDAQTPFIGDIPLLGNLFKQQRHAARKSELVILLRAEIVGDGTWRRDMRETRERVRALEEHWDERYDR